jgi:hypothetical protein
MGNLLTLSDDWAFVEFFLPGLAPTYRPAVQIMRAVHPDVYNWLETAYKHMLDGAEDAFAVRAAAARNHP